MNNDGGYTIYCSKCGAEMSSNSRYCMKCGTLNYDHESNKSMIRFMPKKKKQAYQVGSGKFIFNHNENSTQDIRMSVSSRTGNKTTCFILNFLVYLICMVLCFYICTEGNFDLELIMASFFPKVAVSISFTFLYIYSIELLFMKCNRAWWEALIPFYNSIVLGDIVFQNKWIGLLAFVPVVNIVYLFVTFYKLGKAFSYPEVLTMLFYPIFLPIIGFGSHIYNGYLFVSSDSQKEVEKEYQYRKIFLFTVILFILLGFALSFMNSLSNGGGQKDIVNGAYFSYASHSLVSKISKSVENGDITCKNGNYSNTSGVYYFEYSDISDATFLLFYIMREPIQGYVKLDNTGGSSKYYVSLSDGTLGFPETLSSEVTISTVQKYTMKSDNKLGNIITCKISN